MGKSSLFCELLDKAESDKQECGDDRLGSQADSSSARFFNRRRGNASRRDASAATSGETKGGSLQNLVASNEFDHFYIPDGSSHSNARGRKFRRGGKDYGVSVSARQREGGSLPSNVNVGGCPSMKTHIEELRDYVPPRNRRETNDLRGDDCLSVRREEATAASECHKSVQTSDCTMIDMEHLGNCDGYTKKSKESSGTFGDNGDAMCEEGTELAMMRAKYTTRATLEVGHGDRSRHLDDVQVDAPLFIPLGGSNEVKVNGDGMAAQMSVQYTDDRPKSRGVPIPYPILSKWLNHGLFVEVGESLHDGNKTSVSHPHHVSEFSLPPKTRASHHWIETATRIPSATTEDKSRVLDENGNALNASERKKLRKAKPKPNYTEIKSETVAGHCGDKNIDDLLKFIESDQEQKSKIRSNQRLVHDKSNEKRRDRKLTKSEDDNSLDNDKLKRSNSLEEVSKTKMEDLTVETTGVVRRPKKQSTFDSSDLRGDRRSWGTEEGQQYYCTDPDDTFPVRGTKKRRDDEARAAPTEEFHVVSTKKQRRKKRSSSGGRSFEDSRRPTTSQRESNQPRRGNVHNFPPHDRDVICAFHGSLNEQQQQRRKSTSSMPPSDKSDASDLDSVHSLPISSTSPKTLHDSSAGSAPLVSYADIAKISSGPVNINVNAAKWPAIGAQFITTSRVNIGVPPVSGSKLYASSVSKSNDNVTLTVNNNAESSRLAETRPKKNAVTNPTVIKTVILSYQEVDKLPIEGEVVENAMNSIASVESDVLKSVSQDKCGKKVRPPVIIMNESEAQDNSSGDELTFGFEVNELLLMSDDVEHLDPNVNRAYNHVEVSFGFELGDSKENGSAQEQPKSEGPESSHISWSDEVDEEVPLAENFDWSSWYREPTELSPPVDHHSLVNYIGSAWESVKRSGLLTYHSDLDSHVELHKQLTNA